MDIKLIALDVDGTLLNDDHEMSEATKRALQHLDAKGCHVVICTGRGPVNSMPLLTELGIHGVGITHNGAATIDSDGQKVLHQFAYSVDEVAPFIHFCRKHRLHYDINTAFDLYLENLGEFEKMMYNKFMVEPIELKDTLRFGEPLVKMSIFAPIEELNEFETELLSIPTDLRVIRSGEVFIDIIHSKATKGEALKQLAEQLGVRRDQIMAIGNYFNDVEMIEYAGIGIAMDNSPDEIKQLADEVTLSNNEDGVLAALQKYKLV